MDRKEALKFLDLAENATDKQFRKTLEEKLEQYQRLSEKSPSAFLRRLNTLHFSTAKQIEKELASFQSEPKFNASIQGQTTVEGISDNEDRILLTMPIIISSLSKPAKKKEKTEPVAFLIRHTEKLSVKPFSLYAGKNFIGRKIHPSIKPFIALEDDEYVSRIHAMIYIDKDDTDKSYIDDSIVSNEGKPSKNGTFLNGNKVRLHGKTTIKENDTIQIGETKFIFRMHTTNIYKIIEEVQESDYVHTIVIRS